MPVIPALWEAEAGGSPEVGSLRPAWPTWRNPTSIKNTKLAGCGGARLLSQLLRRLRQENCLNRGSGVCSEPSLHHCTPAYATRAKCHLKQTNKKNEISQACYITMYMLQALCMPVVPATQEAEVGGLGGRITGVWEVEATVSRSCVTALQPGWQQNAVSIKNKKERFGIAI